MGLYVVDEDQNTLLVALGKVYPSTCTIHTVPYADEVTRVSIISVYLADAKVLLPTSEVMFVNQAVGTFILWPTNLVKTVPDS